MGYVDGSLRSYLDDLAARKPAPGGGSAAALAASIGASLISMVANYTVGSPKYKDSAPQSADIMVKVQQFNTRLHDLIDEDVVAYERLSSHMKEIKNDPVKREKAFKDALRPPFEVCKITAECMKLCGDLALCANKNLITDVAIAAVMLESAFLSAKYNVYANLKSIEDMEFIRKTHEFLAPLEDEIPRLKESIVERCEDVIST